MRVLVTGSAGMLGRTLMRRLDTSSPRGVDLPKVDLTRPRAAHDCIAAESPTIVVHCAAFTAVDACEGQPETAFAVNAQAAANVAAACESTGARLIAISTDYVFGGGLDRPYHEFDEPAPRSVYGASKLAGERAVAALCSRHTIVRIAWLYGQGGPSFVHTMRRLGAEEGAPLRVVDDQIGNPTSCDAVADLIARLITDPIPGIVHGTCEGETSWYGFTREILSVCDSRRILEPCATAEYARPAPRPANSRLDKLVLRTTGAAPMPHWQETLERFFREHPDG